MGDLVRLGVMDGRVIAGGKVSGRGAWACVSVSCLGKVSATLLARAFKRPVLEFSVDDLFVRLQSLARQRVLEMVGLARRANVLCVGVEAIRAKAGKCKLGPVILASDASERVCMQLPGGRAFVASGELSKAAGVYNVYALSIIPGKLAHQAAYWLSVWYECRMRSWRVDGHGA